MYANDPNAPARARLTVPVLRKMKAEGRRIAAITAYDAPLPTPESFEVYPNRDSLPFLADYRFDPGVIPVGAAILVELALSAAGQPPSG